MVDVRAWKIYWLKKPKIFFIPRKILLGLANFVTPYAIGLKELDTNSSTSFHRV